MKKVTLLFILGITLLAPSNASASFFSDLGKWLVPDAIEPAKIEPLPAPEIGVGGVLISPDPAVLTGDTPTTFYLPALGRRSFVIQNGGALDLFLNMSTQLSYQAVPALAPGDVPAALALNAGNVRTVTIFNRSTTTGVFLSKVDLSIASAGTTTQLVGTSVFINRTDAKVASVITGSGTTESVASFTFAFTFNNATNKDVYVSRLINPLSFVTLSTEKGATSSVKFIDANPSSVAGDSATAYVIPAGANRSFEITGIIDNTNGTPGVKKVSITGISYSTSASSTERTVIKDANTLKSLSFLITLGNGKPLKNVPNVTPVVQPPVVTPVSTPSSTSTPTPTQTPIVTSAPIVNVATTTKPKATTTPRTATTTPRSTASPSTTPSPSGSGEVVALVSGLSISFATTSIGTPIIDNGQVIGYPVTFSFTATAKGKTAYFSKNPGMAFETRHTGFGGIPPMISKITATPAVKTGDGGSYFTIQASTSRSFQVSAILKNDGISKVDTQTLHISKIFYGNVSTLLKNSSTTENTSSLKVSIRLNPQQLPNSTPTPDPSSTPSSSPTASPSSTATPSPSGLIALCYAVPTNPKTGDNVVWQVMQSGATASPSYTWTGTDGLSGSTVSVPKKYTTTGRKDSLVSVVSGDQSVTATCYVNVTQSTETPSSSPSSTASPTSTQTPSTTASPSSSSTSFNVDPRKNMVANVLYSLGEFLDSIVSR